MKKKVIFAVATGLFALAMVFNMNVLQSNSAGDMSLESIAVMAQAQSEGGNCTTRDHQCYTYANGDKGCFPLSEPDGGDCDHCECKR